VNGGLANSPLGLILSTFGVESVLLWTAVLLKKRIVVYSDKVQDLQRMLRAIPALVWHRQNWNILKPFCLNDDVSLEELASNPVFCAGFQEPLESRQDIWDLYVDVSAQEITVSENAKKDFVMTSVHKDVAKAMQAFIEEESDDLQIIEGIAAKTKELLGKLELLAGDGGLSLQSLQEQLSNVSLASFLFNVALAEGLASTTGEEEGEDENADSEEPEE